MRLKLCCGVDFFACDHRPQRISSQLYDDQVSSFIIDFFLCVSKNVILSFLPFIIKAQNELHTTNLRSGFFSIDIPQALILLFFFEYSECKPLIGTFWLQAPLIESCVCVSTRAY